ncbi:helix-turn-helix domain-containing protein [Thermopolyspora sp. NPDC052614]|uniref:helix-turn-helix domain-containing protein n=1 Tax=Thermopolyspora sp. NPDC052614 TaxID=3155682 RepID=UPI00342C1603
MPEQFYSVEQVADLLDLHVKTVRGYVRDGRLKAVRIGKQYRISRQDLEGFLGHPAPVPARESARRTRHAEVSGVVHLDAISPEAMSRLSTMVITAAREPRDGEPLHIQTVYDEERASMKIIVVGGLESTAEMLRLVAALTRDL